MSDRQLVGLAVLLLLAVAAAYWLLRRAPEAAARRLVAAHVAIEPAGGGATVGTVQIEAGTEFRLHLVVESRDRRGRPTYYTEAERLAFGGREVPAEALAPWPGREPGRVLWFTVEPLRPFVELAAGDEPSLPELEEVFRSDWPRAWSVPGSLVPIRETFLPGMEAPVARERFGVRRFHVRFELLDEASRILPRVSLRSPGAAEAAAAPEDYPTLVAELATPLGLPSRAFGLPQIEPGALGAAARRQALATIAGWLERDIAFARVALLDRWLGTLGTSWPELEWTTVETGGSAPFGGRGDLLRAGSRWVILYADRGAGGRLDRADLCLDYDRGPLVLTLGEIFSGGGLLERATPAATPGTGG